MRRVRVGTNRVQLGETESESNSVAVLVEDAAGEVVHERDEPVAPGPGAMQVWIIVIMQVCMSPADRWSWELCTPICVRF